MKGSRVAQAVAAISSLSFVHAAGTGTVFPKSRDTHANLLHREHCQSYQCHSTRLLTANRPCSLVDNTDIIYDSQTPPQAPTIRFRRKALRSKDGEAGKIWEVLDRPNPRNLHVSSCQFRIPGAP